ERIERALAEVHGGGVPLAWQVRGPLADADALVKKLTAGEKPDDGWRLVPASGTDARVRLTPAKAAGAGLAYSELTVAEPTKVAFFTTGPAATVYLNGKAVHTRDRPAVPGPYPERFEATLAKGTNRVLIRLSAAKGAGEFSLRFRRKSASADHER